MGEYGKYKRLYAFHDIIGKQVIRACHPSAYSRDGLTAIFFSDDTFMVLEAYLQESVDIDDLSNEVLLRFDLITRKEYERREQIIKTDQQTKEEQKELEQERQEYIRLSKKFGSIADLKY